MSAPDWIGKAVSVGTTYLGGPPYPANDPSILVDIGVAALNPLNTWTSLPAGFAYTADGTSGFDPVKGFLCGAGNNNAGKVAASNTGFGAVSSNQGTIYLKMDRRAFALDKSVVIAGAFADGVGSTPPYGATAPNFPPALFWVGNTSLNPSIIPRMGTGSADILLNNATSILSTQIVWNNCTLPSVNRDPNFAEFVFTWSGTQYYLYYDNQLIQGGTITAFGAGIFGSMGIGNMYFGPNGSIGGNLGPFYIQRFQVSTAFFPPPLYPKLVAVHGDSYSSSGGVGGSYGAQPPGSTTIANVNSVQVMRFYGSNPPYGAQANPTNGQETWCNLLQSYAFRQLGAYFPMYGANRAGYQLYYTNVPNTPQCIDDFAHGITTYSDALNAAQPEIVLCMDSVNNFNTDANTYLPGGATPLTPVADMQFMFNYWANNNPNLRAILFMEQLSYEICQNVPNGQAQTAKAGAIWRAMMRQAFQGQQFRAGTRGVPVVYIPTAERWSLSPEYPNLLIASNPTNTSSSSDAQSGGLGNIHPCASGHVRIADLWWPYLKALLVRSPN